MDVLIAIQAEELGTM